MNEPIYYFQNELSNIRNAVDNFSHTYPGIASELRLSAGQSSDPHVEQLLQSFAWLTSQLRFDMDQRRYETPNYLLMSLYPNLLSSIPCMSVMEANVLPDDANFVNGYSLEKGRLFSTWSTRHRSVEGDEKNRLNVAYNVVMTRLSGP